MTNPLAQVLAYTSAIAEVVQEKAGTTLQEVLSDIGKFDAEQKERMRQLATEIQARAEGKGKRESSSMTPRKITIEEENTEALEELIDELRAEIATLKSELQNYRQS
ncbi:MAG: hypothetical protein HC796_10740 [Synechococcaceae cyanobacterium RL_1_2]|nr:hypothetical protein [Synechococcaceae cyanobacterium RL_1_2]